MNPFGSLKRTSSVGLRGKIVYKGDLYETHEAKAFSIVVTPDSYYECPVDTPESLIQSCTKKAIVRILWAFPPFPDEFYFGFLSSS